MPTLPIRSPSPFNQSFDFLDSRPTSLSLEDAFLLAFIGTENGKIYLIDLNTSKSVFTFAGHSDPVTSLLPLTIKQNLCILLSGDQSGTLKMWDISLKKQVASVKAHSFQINSIAVNSALSFFATGSEDGSCKIFNFNNLKDAKVLRQAAHGGVNHVSFVGDDTVIYAANDRRAYLWTIDGCLV